ncbi:hypothetical protein A3C87_02395 [Candidatus Kaiserbacteria bacterium RIFCSPHIGHO2_02_FULL_49_34]|uniref:Phosphatidylethanolamine-binding protein n=1 Tax=Candidatus Kaiserbacteria bacterium RIFCSPHIGHO2_02_FULL_49_34 TaxID=1798491 RepID=A0A1F6DLW7_9BACT|nr:MAG: hypothetical protein A3C87_02395 [Candidatus Kaiserbacteria bacterium RIFCSPHIGHO2_02_FULL_49_34]
MQLTSSAFAPGEMIPSIHTCDGTHMLPPLQITNVPEGTKSFVLVMDDADIPQEVKEAKGIEKFDHLIFYNIPGDLREFTDDILATQTFAQSVNSAGAATYTGPCPPRDLEPYTHRYSFRVYALSGNLSFIKTPTLDEVEQAAQSSALAHAELVGTYTRHK